MFALAAESCHLDLSKWAREHQCPWDDRTGTLATINGHFELLERVGPTTDRIHLNICLSIQRLQSNKRFSFCTSLSLFMNCFL